MSDDMRRILNEAAAQPSVSPESATILKRGKRARLLKRVSAASFSVLSVGVLVLAVRQVSLSPAAPQPGAGKQTKVASNQEPLANQGGYSFSQIEVDNEGLRSEGTQAVLNFEYQWVNGENPGVRDCTFSVFDESGDRVGNRTSQFSTSLPSNEASLSVTTDAPARSASIECGERLDDPSGTYEFTAVEVRTPSDHGFSEVLVEYRVNWTGSGETPGRTECIAEIQDANGTVILVDEFGFRSQESTGGGEMSIGVPNPGEFEGEPATAEISCEE